MTLVGVGGVGKTRLAVEVAAVTGAQAPDGGVFVDLSALASAQTVVPAILRAVDLQVEGDLAALRGLRALDALVVLDNCEHLIEPAAAAAAAMLEPHRGGQAGDFGLNLTGPTTATCSTDGGTRPAKRKASRPVYVIMRGCDPRGAQRFRAQPWWLGVKTLGG